MPSAIREGAILVETLHDIRRKRRTSLAAVVSVKSQQSRNKENSSVMSDSVVCIYTLNKEKHKGNLPEDPAGSLKYITAQNTTQTGGLEPEEDAQICEMAQTLPILVERKAAQSAERSSKCKTTQTSMTPKEHKIGQEKDISDPREMEQLSKSLKNVKMRARRV